MANVFQSKESMVNLRSGVYISVPLASRLLTTLSIQVTLDMNTFQ